jgi:hypothetical protein
MNNKGRFSFLVSTLCLLAAAMTAKAADEFAYYMVTTNDITYEIWIAGYNGSSGVARTPDTIEGWPVTQIAPAAFYDCTSLSDITIGSGVTKIGDSAFSGRTNLKNITIGSGVTEVGGVAFAGCSSLTSLIIPGSVANIGYGAFQDCTRLNSIAMLNGVISVGDYAFVGSTNLDIVYMPDSVTTIGSAFAGCSLKNINIPDGVATIADNAFANCDALTSLTIGSGVTSIGDYPFGVYFGWDSVTNLTTITVDANNATYYSTSGVLFSKNPNALIVYPPHKDDGKFVIPVGVTHIKQSAVFGCNSLTNITFPSSVTRMDSGAVWYCPNLQRVDFLGNAPSGEPDALGYIPAYIYYLHGTTGWNSQFCGMPTRSSVPFTYTTHNGTITITGDSGNMPQNYYAVIPDTIDGLSVTRIGDDASWTNNFGYLDYMIGVAIPNSVIDIGTNAFAACIFTTVTIPDSVKTIGERAFAYCNALTDVKIGNGVTDIGDEAFFIGYESSLTNVTFGTSVANIGSGAFQDNPNLTSVVLPNSVTNIGAWAFFCENRGGLTSITIPDNCINIDDGAFSGCLGLTNAVIGSSVSRIGNNAFGFCGLSSITLPDSVKTVGDYAFCACTNLTSVIIGNSCKTIGNYAFSACINLTSVVIGNGCTDIGEGAFSYVYDYFYYHLGNIVFEPSRLSHVTLGTHVANIGKLAFGHNPNLTSMVLPSSVTNIGARAFEESGLTSITIPDSCINIEPEAFYGCFALTNAVIGNGLTKIDRGTFGGCGFKNITIPNSITNISGGFSSCTNLTSITFPTNVVSVEDGSFWGCTSLTNIMILNSDILISASTFGECTSLTAVYFTGNAPNMSYSDWESNLFPNRFRLHNDKVTIYHLKNAAGWPPIPDEWNWCPTALWQYELDSDNDGLPDWWVFLHFGNPTIANPNVICSNGVNTVLEAYLAGTNPNDPPDQLPLSTPLLEGFVGDDFNDNVKDTAKWGADFLYGSGSFLQEANGRLQFRGNGSEGIARPWTQSSGSDTSNWEVAADLHVGALKLYPNDYIDMHLIVAPQGQNLTNNHFKVSLSLNLYGDLYSRNYGSYMTTAGVVEGYEGYGTDDLEGRIRIAFDATTKMLVASCNGNLLSSNLVNSSWGMTEHSTFQFALGGTFGNYQDDTLFDMNYAGTDVYADNFELVDTSFSPGKDYTYTTNSGSITITGYTGTGGDVTIPGKINGVPVTLLGDWVFNNNTNLTRVIIPSSVIAIGEATFDQCTSLTNITLGSGVTSYGSDALSGLTCLTAINVDTSNTVFSSVQGVLFDKNQTTLILYPRAKAGSFTIPDTLSSIEFGVFYCCTNLTALIANAANPYYSSKNGILFNKSWTSLIQFPGAQTGSYAVTGTVTSVGGAAFAGCPGLTDVTIGSSVTNIGGYAFVGCVGLTGITVNAANAFYSSTNGVFFNKSQTVLIQCPGGKVGSYATPVSVTYIEGMAFAYCIGLTNITLSSGVTSIEPSTFENCINLKRIVIGNGVTSIGDSAFWNCTSLASVMIPNSVVTIEGWAFENCTSVTNIIIGNGVAHIGQGAFESCPRLISATMGSSVIHMSDLVFAHCTALTGVYFQGNAPTPGDHVFYDANNTTVYRLSGAMGWPTVPDAWADRPTALWQSQVPDIDADRIPDSWELQYFGGTTKANPTAICSNGVNTVLQAYIAGLNPNDPQSRFQISNFRSRTTGNAFEWNAVSGRVYSVYWTTNLLSGFHCLESTIPWTRASFTNTTEGPCGFYKIDVSLP